jgi:hypothetical protein
MSNKDVVEMLKSGISRAQKSLARNRAEAAFQVKLSLFSIKECLP